MGELGAPIVVQAAVGGYKIVTQNPLTEVNLGNIMFQMIDSISGGTSLNYSSFPNPSNILPGTVYAIPDFEAWGELTPSYNEALGILNNGIGDVGATTGDFVVTIGGIVIKNASGAVLGGVNIIPILNNDLQSRVVSIDSDGIELKPIVAEQAQSMINLRNELIDHFSGHGTTPAPSSSSDDDDPDPTPNNGGTTSGGSTGGSTTPGSNNGSSGTDNTYSQLDTNMSYNSISDLTSPVQVVVVKNDDIINAIRHDPDFRFASPIFIDLDGDDNITINELFGSDFTFDMDDDGYLETSAWVGSNDGVLVIDLDASGNAGADGDVTQGREFAFADWNTDANTDIEGLSLVFDTDHNDIFNSVDARWAEFRIWQDINGNGQVDDGELNTLDHHGIESIDLTLEGEAFSLLDATEIHGQVSITATDGSNIVAADVSLTYSKNGYKFIETASGTTIEFENPDAEDVGFGKLNSSQNDFNLGDDTSSWVSAEGNNYNNILDASNKTQNVILSGMGGDDHLIGGAGDDILVGGDGSDIFDAGAGDDSVYMGVGDHLRSSNNAVQISGGAGYDTLYMDEDKKITTVNIDAYGFEAVVGSDKDDSIQARYSDVDHNFSGGAGDDTLIGAGGNDYLDGGTGKDTLLGNAGDDMLFMDADDVFEENGVIKISGGLGYDSLFMSADSTQTSIDIDKYGFEAIEANGEDNIINGTNSHINYFISGNDGDDVLEGANRNDTLIGGEGDDSLIGLNGNDYLLGGFGNDILDGGNGNDTYIIGAGTGTSTIVNEIVDNWWSANDDTVWFTDLILSELKVDFHNDYFRFKWGDGDEAGELLVEDSGQHIEQYEFADGTGFKSISFESNGRITFKGSSAKNDVITSNGSHSRIKGYGGDDTLIAGSKTGSQRQYLYGGKANDTFVIGSDTGRTMVTAAGELINEGNDKVVFNDLTLADMTISYADYTGDNDDWGNTLRFTWGSGNDAGEFQVAQEGQYVEQYEFADGTGFKTISIEDSGRITFKGSSATKDVITSNGSHSSIKGYGCELACKSDPLRWVIGV